MPLTKGDKLIIIGAVVLALAVVAGLAAWRKPHLFFGGRPAPEMTTRDFTVPAPAAPGAEPAVAAPSQAAPPASPQVSPQVSPVAGGGNRETASLPVPVPGAPPAAATAPPTAPQPVPHPEPQSVSAAAPQPVPQPAGPGVAPPPGKEPVSPEVVSQHPLFAGDATLDKMFADMGEEAAASKVNTGKHPAAKEPAAPAQTAAPAKAPGPGVESAESLDIPPDKAKPALTAAKPVKDKPPVAAKTPPTPAKGAVVAVSASDKPGEYVLTVTTSSPVGDVTRLYMDGPPRLIIDLDGRWTYTGALSIAGKSPLIQQVRVGKHPDKLRLVLDLAPDAVTRLREAPIVDRTPNGVVIRLPK